jgi:hypothetical protein
LERFHAPQKKSKGFAQMRPDGKRKSCAAKKILHEQTAARMRPDSKKILLRSDDATGQQKKILQRGQTLLRGGDPKEKAARADTVE